MAQAAPEYPNPPASQRASARDPDTPVVKSATEARQGVTGHNARYVLFFSLGGVILAFALIYAAFWA